MARPRSRCHPWCVTVRMSACLAMTDVRNHANLVWGIDELLRGDYKRADYGKVILPLVVIGRLDQSLEDTKARVVTRSEQLRAQGIENVEPALVRLTGQQFY